MTTIAELEILSGVETEATKMMLALKDWPRIDMLAQTLPELSIRCLQAKELMEPLPDWESAARQAGWKSADMTHGMFVKAVNGQALAQSVNSWKEACELEGLVVPKFPVEHVFIVTPRLGAMLELWGERIDKDLFGWIMWADFRQEQQHKYLLKTLSSIYQNSTVWRAATDESVSRYYSQ